MEQLRILLLGDASNYHATLATGLRALGHDVTVISNGSKWQKTSRDIDISRRPGKIGGAIHWWNMRFRLRSAMSGYDIVQITNPFFTELRPHRLRAIFDNLRTDNRAVFMAALGTDPFYVKECLNPSSPIRYSEWRTEDNQPGPLAIANPDLIQRWTNQMMLDHASYIYQNVDGVTTALWEYHVQVSNILPPDKYAYIGLPIDLQAIAKPEITINPGVEPVNIFLGRHSYRQPEKGTDMLEKAARTVVQRYPDAARLEIVEDKPYNEYCRLLESAHILLDQAYSFTPATNALIAMAMGKNVVSGAEPEFYDFIGEQNLRPIINASPHLDLMIETLDKIVSAPHSIEARGHDSRRFVEKHHDCTIVARRAVDFWKRRLNELGR